jgi:hypothetical protein
LFDEPLQIQNHFVYGRAVPVQSQNLADASLRHQLVREKFWRLASRVRDCRRLDRVVRASRDAEAHVLDYEKPLSSVRQVLILGRRHEFAQVKIARCRFGF